MSDDQDHPSGGDAGTERALDELRAALEQLAVRMGAGFREDLAQIRAIAASVAERDLTADVEALRVDVATLVGRDPSRGLRDDVAALRTDLDRLASSDDVTARIAPLQATVERISARLDDDSGRTQVLARFEALESKLDRLAAGGGSAEVLAHLDRLGARLDSLPSSRQIANLSGDLRAHLIDALAGFDGAGPGSLLEQLQDNLADVASGEVVGALWDEVRQLRTDLPGLVSVSEPVAADREPDPQLTALTDELAVLRTELAELVEGLVRSRIDDGRRADPGEVPAAPAVADTEAIEALADQVASLRDFVATELDTVSQRVSSRLDAAASRSEPVPSAELRATVDPEVIEGLRDEIRASGAIADQVIDALREELKALRRRIAVKASERVLDDQQLGQIADAVAARLADGRGEA